MGLAQENIEVTKRYPLAPISFIGDRVAEKDKCYFEEDQGMIIDTSALYSKGIPSEELMLNMALNEIGKNKTSAFKQIKFEYESLYNSALRAAFYLTPLIPSENGVSLLGRCLLSGINTFNDARKKSFLHNDDPAIKMAAFIKGMSQPFHQIMFLNIYGQCDNAWTQWKPLTESIYEWVTRHQFPKLLVVPTSNKLSADILNAASNKLLFEIFNFADLSLCGISKTTNITISDQ